VVANDGTPCASYHELIGAPACARLYAGESPGVGKVDGGRNLIDISIGTGLVSDFDSANGNGAHNLEGSGRKKLIWLAEHPSGTMRANALSKANNRLLSCKHARRFDCARNLPQGSSFQSMPRNNVRSDRESR